MRDDTERGARSGDGIRRRTVSIVIPVFNRVELTTDCLEAVAASTRGEFEVVVVDDGSTDGTAALLARFGAALTVVRHEENRGFAHACNAGARVASGELLVFLNNDTLPRPGWLDALTAAAEAPDVGAVGARLLYPDGTIQHAGIAFSEEFEPFHVHQGALGDAPSVVYDRDCEAVTGACLLVPRAVFREVGGFDEGYRMYFEDVDLCLKIRASGRRVRYAAASVVVHLERASSASFQQAYALNRSSRERFRARWVTTPRPARAPLRILLQARDTLFSQRGGDTVVTERLRTGLEARGVAITIGAAHQSPVGYDVVHTLNFATPEITRGIAERAEAAGVPLVVTALYEDWPRFLNLAHATANVFAAMAARDAARLDPALLRAFLERVRAVPPATRLDNQVTAGVARLVLACGASERDRLLADHPTLREVRVVPFGSDAPASEETLPAGAFGAAYGVRDYVLCVARLEPRKNQLMLLEALRDDSRPIVLAAGDFSYAARYVELCRRFRRRGPTLVLGRLPASMLAAAFREAAVHCLPSWYELPGLVSLEAARAGTRVVATSWGALPDYLGDAVEYCEPDDPESIARAIAAASTRSPERAAARAAAFTWERTASETLAAYEEITRGGGPLGVPTAVPTVSPSRPGASARRSEQAPRAEAAACSVEPAPCPGGASLAKAEQARRAGDFPAVLAAAAHALDEGADPGHVAELRALALVQLRRFGEAREAYGALLASPARARRAAFGLGVIALEHDDLAAAETWLRRATEGEADADAWATLGLCQARQAKTGAAWTSFAEARTLDPAHRTALHGLITVAAQTTRFGELEHHLRDYLSRVGDDVDVRYALASCLYAAGRDAESRALACEVLARAPGHAPAVALAAELSA